MEKDQPVKDRESAERDANISSLESQIKSLLERSTGTVAKLDGQISKLDEHLSKSSAVKRRKSRTAASAVRAVTSTNALSGLNGAHPFNKWLVCIAGSDSSRAAESEMTERTHPLTLEEISCVSPKSFSRKVPNHTGRTGPQLTGKDRNVRRHTGAGRRQPENIEGYDVEFPHMVPEQGRDGVARELASSPGTRVPDYSFHAPSALSSFSPIAPRTQSPLACEQNFCRNPIVEARQPTRSNQVDSFKSPHQHASGAWAGKHVTVEAEDLHRLEVRMEEKLRAMFQSVSNEVTVHFASKRDIDTLSGQLTRLREEVVVTKSDVAVALKECRAARVAFASEHWSVKKMLEQLEDMKRKHRQELLELEQRVLAARSSSPTEQVSHFSKGTGAGRSPPGSSMYEQVTRLEIAVSSLDKQVAESTSMVNENASSAAALRSLVEEVFEKCDTVQQATNREINRFQEEALKRNRDVQEKYEQLRLGYEASETKIIARCSETDENVARVCKDTRKYTSKVTIFLCSCSPARFPLC